jgi:hypothetical protein
MCATVATLVFVPSVFSLLHPKREPALTDGQTATGPQPAET